MKVNADQSEIMGDYLRSLETTLQKQTSKSSSQDPAKTAQWLVGQEDLELFYSQHPQGKLTGPAAVGAATAAATAAVAAATVQAVATLAAAAPAHAAPAHAAHARGNLLDSSRPLDVNQTSVKGLSVDELITIRATNI